MYHAIGMKGKSRALKEFDPSVKDEQDTVLETASAHWSLQKAGELLRYLAHACAGKIADT